MTANGEVMKFDGFLKVYLEGKDDEDEEDTEGILPPLAVNQVLDFREMTATEKFTRACTKIYRSIAGKKTGRAWYWPAFYLCPYYYHHNEAQLCGQKR